MYIAFCHHPHRCSSLSAWLRVLFLTIQCGEDLLATSGATGEASIWYSVSTVVLSRAFLNLSEPKEPYWRNSEWNAWILKRICATCFVMHCKDVQSEYPGMRLSQNNYFLPSLWKNVARKKYNLRNSILQQGETLFGFLCCWAAGIWSPRYVRFTYFECILLCRTAKGLLQDQRLCST